MAALEERTEQLLERTRIARELHDSIGHALTVAVVQAGAARAAGDPGFTDRALVAIEETGRAALEDLERVLGVLRESRKPVSSRPTLADADRLLESARASGAKVEAEVTGPRGHRAGVRVSRGGPTGSSRRALTNVLRACGGGSGSRTRPGHRRHPRPRDTQPADLADTRPRTWQRPARHTRAHGPARRTRPDRTGRGRLAGSCRASTELI
ncbi:two-component system sensor kinase [Streptomyces viridochromogenes DSM 40736]|uniref:histidine kinase n=1 Tax=Streptomyces viridochromogenes (strain DSM 40736 / JCM 4977 / BCRC 1201 / Tue 494) TaxID=591159 RepID=D9XGK9_STRVT|nr:two-component system sensor kinase [Streptomyces viridochromogenes DSM 40736]